MKFLVTLEHDEEGWVVAECPSLPGCVSQGRTIDEALANIREAIALSLETRHDLGMIREIEIAEVEVETPAD
jgi:predicted RNase H-like HicB family nuclease